MTQIVLSPSSSGDATHLHVDIHVQAEVIAAEVIRRKANVWLLENIGNLLRAESPELILAEPMNWRVDIVLTSPSQGRLGVVGRLKLNATTGEVLADETLAQEVLLLAHAIAPHSSSSPGN